MRISNNIENLVIFYKKCILGIDRNMDSQHLFFNKLLPFSFFTLFK